jgi:hypothetical protein
MNITDKFIVSHVFNEMMRCFFFPFVLRTMSNDLCRRSFSFLLLFEYLHVCSSCSTMQCAHGNLLPGNSFNDIIYERFAFTCPLIETCLHLTMLCEPTSYSLFMHTSEISSHVKCVCVCVCRQIGD